MQAQPNDVGDTPRIVTVVEAFPRCRPIFEKWAKCVRDHPTRSPTFVACEKFAIMLGWCVTLSLCPQQARALEKCCGGIPELITCPAYKCVTENGKLDACMERHT